MIIYITIALLVMLGLLQMALSHRTTASMYSRDTTKWASSPISMPTAVKYTSFDVTEHLVLEAREMTRDAKCVVEFFTFS